MPQEVLSPYEPTTLTQNISYGLPAVLCNVTVSAACETSTNGSAWIPFNSGTETSAKYIRSAGVGTIVTCKPVMSGVGGESGGSAPAGIEGSIQYKSGTALGGSNQFFLTPAPGATPDLRIGEVGWGHGSITIGGISIGFHDGSVSAAISSIQFTDGCWVRFGSALLVERTLAATGNGVIMGAIANISDSTVNTLGATVAGGGSNHVLARWNGTIWKVIGL